MLHSAGSSISLEQLMPDLLNLNTGLGFGGYCLTIPNPDIDLSFGIDSMWIDATQREYSIPLPELSIPSSFVDPLELPFSFKDSLILQNLHWPEGLEDFVSASISGTMTIHFTFPEGLQFGRMFLHPFLSKIILPNYLLIDPYDISDQSVHWEWQNGQSVLYFSNPGVWIPREGLDISMKVRRISPDVLGIQEDGNRCLRGLFSGSGVFWLYPEDAQSDAEVLFNGSLTISVSFSDLSFDFLECNLNPDQFETEKTVKVPFPKLKDERIDHFAKPCLFVEYQMPPEGRLYYITQRFFSIKGEESFSTPATGIPFYCPKVLFMAETDAIWREGIEDISYPQLKDIFCVLPDSLGACFSCTGLTRYINPGKVCNFRFSSKWYIPWSLTGTNWGMTCNSVEYPIRDLVDDAVPGTEIIVTVWYDNQQPFSVKCTPVFVDSEGIQHELTDDAFLIEGGYPNNERTGSFAAHWVAGDKVKDEIFFLKLEFGECINYVIRPGLSLRLGIEKIKKTMYID